SSTPCGGIRRRIPRSDLLHALWTNGSRVFFPFFTFTSDYKRLGRGSVPRPVGSRVSRDRRSRPVAVLVRRLPGFGLLSTSDTIAATTRQYRVILPIEAMVNQWSSEEP